MGIYEMGDELRARLIDETSPKQRREMLGVEDDKALDELLIHMVDDATESELKRFLKKVSDLIPGAECDMLAAMEEDIDQGTIEPNGGSGIYAGHAYVRGSERCRLYLCRRVTPPKRWMLLAFDETRHNVLRMDIPERSLAPMWSAFSQAKNEMMDRLEAGERWSE